MNRHRCGPINRDQGWKPHLPAPIISLPRFIGGIETEGRKCLSVFRIHYNLGHSCGIEEQLAPIQWLYRSVVAVDNRFKCRNL